MILSYITIGVLLALVAYLSSKYQQTLKAISQQKQKTLQQLNKQGIILQHIGSYFILIDRDFIVKETNYYLLNQLTDDGSIKRVGDLLHCKSAVEAGECGKHVRCKMCGIRAVASRSFIRSESFRRYEASMKLLSYEDNQIIPCDVSVSGDCVMMNNEQHMVLTVYDISELKNVQRLLDVEKENALSCDKLKASFIGNMSHEIRTPLNAIIGFSSLLAITPNEEEKDTYIDIINKNNDRLLQLVTDILDLSQMDAGMLELDYSEFEVNDLLREVYELFKIRMNEKPEITFVCNAGMESLLLYSERRRVMQILVNLLNNAIKFTQKGEIQIGCQLKDGREIYFYVSDTGAGISLEESNKIFNRFMKLDREIPGTGLGLTLAQALVEKLGGRIGVESHLGQGSTFWFILPMNSAF